MGFLKSLQIIFTNNTDLAKVQKNTQDVVSQLQVLPLPRKRLINVTINTGQSNTINTGMNGQLIDWQPISKQGVGDIWEISRTANTLVLTSSATVTTNILLY